MPPPASLVGPWLFVCAVVRTSQRGHRLPGNGVGAGGNPESNSCMHLSMLTEVTMSCSICMPAPNTLHRLFSRYLFISICQMNHRMPSSSTFLLYPKSKCNRAVCVVEFSGSLARDVLWAYWPCLFSTPSPSSDRSLEVYLRQSIMDDRSAPLYY